MDAHKTRKEGRILAKRDSVGTPDIKEIMRAAQELGLKPSCEDKKMYPRFWWEHKGRILVDFEGSKRETTRLIARRIKSLRTQHDS